MADVILFLHSTASIRNSALWPSWKQDKALQATLTMHLQNLSHFILKLFSLEEPTFTNTRGFKNIL